MADSVSRARPSQVASDIGIGSTSVVAFDLDGPCTVHDHTSQVGGHESVNDTGTVASVIREFPVLCWNVSSNY